MKSLLTSTALKPIALAALIGAAALGMSTDKAEAWWWGPGWGGPGWGDGWGRGWGSGHGRASGNFSMGMSGSGDMRDYMGYYGAPGWGYGYPGYYGYGYPVPYGYGYPGGYGAYPYAPPPAPAAPAAPAKPKTN